MATIAEQRRQFFALLDTLSPELAEAFRASFAEITDRISLKRVIEFLKVGDVNGALEAMYIEAAAFAPVQAKLAEIFALGGDTFVRGLPMIGRSIVVRFDARALRAEAWLRDHSSSLITYIVDEQREMIRQRLTAGLAAGRAPRATALEIVGRINRATGKREGGIIGLHPQQVAAADKLKDDLLSGDPARMRAVVASNEKGKRFRVTSNNTILRAAKAGKPMTAEAVEAIRENYVVKAMQSRGRTIARTETLTSLNASHDEAFRQGLAKTNYTEADVVRVWDSAGDRRVRHTHAVLDGKTVRGLTDPFASPSGARLRFPGDRSFGAPASEIINCRCRVQYRIDVFNEYR